MTLMHECDNCKCPDERVFRDSYTGLSLCLMCLYPIIGQVTTCPGTEGDNLKQLLDDEGSTYMETTEVQHPTAVRPAVTIHIYNDPNR